MSGSCPTPENKLPGIKKIFRRYFSIKVLENHLFTVYISWSSGYSAAWFSAFDWGSKGPEFESPYPDHFFARISKKHEQFL